MTFQATIEINGVNPFVRVSAEQAHELQSEWKKPMPVTVQINGEPKEPWKINMMPVGDGSFYLYLNGIVRSASKTQVGDRVTVDVSFDDTYAGGPSEMPQWFATALASNPLASKNYESLPPSRQKEIVRYLSNLKSKEAKERNLVRALDVLSGDPGHFMGRDWEEGK